MRHLKSIVVVISLAAVAWAVVAVLRLPTPGPVALRYVKEGDHAALSACLRSNPGVLGWRDELGYSLLHWAAAMSDGAATDILLRAGADPNARDLRGRTPLHVAATTQLRGGDALITSLVAGGTDVNAADARGATALQFAQTIGRFGLAQHLLAAGAAPTPAPADGTRLASGDDVARDASPPAVADARGRRVFAAGPGWRRAARRRAMEASGIQRPWLRLMRAHPYPAAAHREG